VAAVAVAAAAAAVFGGCGAGDTAAPAAPAVDRATVERVLRPASVAVGAEAVTPASDGARAGLAVTIPAAPDGDAAAVGTWEASVVGAAVAAAGPAPVGYIEVRSSAAGAREPILNRLPVRRSRLAESPPAWTAAHKARAGRALRPSGLHLRRAAPLGLRGAVLLELSSGMGPGGAVRALHLRTGALDDVLGHRAYALRVQAADGTPVAVLARNPAIESDGPGGASEWGMSWVSGGVPGWAVDIPGGSSR
jgi:hypothetical protein